MISYFIIEIFLVISNILTLNHNPTDYISTQKYSKNLDFISTKEIILDNSKYKSIIFAKDLIPSSINDFITRSYDYNNIFFIFFYKDEENYIFSNKLIDSLKYNLSNIAKKNIKYHYIGFLTNSIKDGYVLYVLYN